MLRLLIGLVLVTQPATKQVQESTPSAADAGAEAVLAATAETTADVADSTAAEFDEGALPPGSKDLFVAKCSSCHTVGKGVRIGPDLEGVTKKRKANWITRMIKAPSRMLDTDPDARALLAEFKNVRMPDLGLNDEQVAGLTELLVYCSDNPCDLAPKLRPVVEATTEDKNLGRALFLGHVRLKNEGPPCVSCHNVAGLASILRGGNLSKDLTHVFARLGDDGLDAALRNPAFPLMNKIFADHPLAPEEAFALRSFLYEANRGDLEAVVAGDVQPISVPLASALVAVLVLIILNAAWSRRLRGIRQPLVNKRERTS